MGTDLLWGVRRPPAEARAGQDYWRIMDSPILAFIRTIIILAAFCLCASAQTNETRGMTPRASPADYQAQTQAGAMTISADFAGHAVPKPEGPLSTEDYVVVEAGLFGAAGAPIKLSIEDFSLRINGKKTPLPSRPSGFVARSLKDPQWVAPEEAEPKSKSKGGISSGGGQSDSSS